MRGTADFLVVCRSPRKTSSLPGRHAPWQLPSKSTPDRPGHAQGHWGQRLAIWYRPRYVTFILKATDQEAMQHTSLAAMQCPIARSLDRVGEWWSILILRDAFHGLSRFDQFEKSLKVAPNILSRRLTGLVRSGLLERRRYCDRPPRHEYVLTERGRDFRPVLWALLAWGNKHFAPEGESVVLVDRTTGRRADPMMVDANSGKPLVASAFRSAAGPAADVATRQRHADRSATVDVRRQP